MIEAVNLFKEYRIGGSRVAALNGIDLAISPGEFVGILGNSGSGKSTLIHLIAGLTRPSKGEVRIRGKSIFEMNDRQISAYRNQELGFVFQSFHLIPEMTAIENVMLPLAYSRLSYKKREQVAALALEQVGLSHRFYHKPTQLSGGQMQRVSIARAMVNSPGILIADEPTGNLDCRSANRIMELLKDINQKGVTILMVTHNTEYESNFSKKITIKDGRIFDFTR